MTSHQQADTNGLPQPRFHDLTFLIQRAAEQYREVGFFQCDGQRRSTVEMVNRAEAIAQSLLSRGLTPGDRVAILAHNCLEYVEVDLALIFAGLVRVPLNARLGIREWEFVLDDSQSRLIFVDPRLPQAEQLEGLGIETCPFPIAGETHSPYESLVDSGKGGRGLPTLDPEDTCWLPYTSGTTGKPKGVMLSRRAILQVCWNLLLEFGAFQAGSESVLTQPLSHGSGYFVLPIVLTGGVCSLMPSFDAVWLAEAMCERPIGLVKLVPVMLQDLIQELNGSPELDIGTIIYGAAPIPPKTLEDALDLFGPRLAQIYGQTEAPVTITCLRPTDHAVKGVHLSSAGRSWSTVDVRVMNDEGREVETGQEGEVVVSGRHQMTGYWGLSDMTSAVLTNGWIHTRDAGRIDDRGYVYLLGRIDDMINTGGFTVAPKEIEVILDQHPAVVESIVVGVPHERWGQQIQAVVRLREGRGVTEEQLIDFTRPELGFRRPRKVVFVESIPRNPYGKVDRTAVMDLVADTPSS